MRQDDPEAPPRVRAVQFRARILATVPMVTVAEAAGRLGCTVEEIAALAAYARLLVIPTDGGDRVPAFQIVGSDVLSGLPEVLTALAAVPIESPWVRLDWLLAPLDRADPRSVVDLLRAGSVEEAVEIARGYGEMGR